MQKQKELTVKELNDLVQNLDKEVATKEAQIQNWKNLIAKTEKDIENVTAKKASVIFKTLEAKNINVMNFVNQILASPAAASPNN